MHKLIGDLERKSLSDRTELFARYRRLLKKGDDATDSEITELRAVVEKLGFNIEKVKSDAHAIAMAPKLQSLIDGTASAEKRMQDARRDHEAFAAEAETQIEAIRTKLRAKLEARHAAETAFFSCQRAARQLIELQTSNRELLGVSEGEIAESLDRLSGGANRGPIRLADYVDNEQEKES